MTILNALRYGPLYSWSISPPKAKNMQEANQAADTAREEWEEEEQILHVAGRETAEHRGVGEAAWISLRDEDGVAFHYMTGRTRVAKETAASKPCGTATVQQRMERIRNFHGSQRHVIRPARQGQRTQSQSQRMWYPWPTQSRAGSLQTSGRRYTKASSSSADSSDVYAATGLVEKMG
ncbi:hypothetical protein HDK77DRAFT_432026 [Phyllosticta capitalensis]|uniref:Uncharacterized protein n=1 Tax=Phyllosticta capitalensis TaxID=121624 RepID=A0ABR1Y8M4_9PEZI